MTAEYEIARGALNGPSTSLEHLLKSKTTVSASRSILSLAHYHHPEFHDSL